MQEPLISIITVNLNNSMGLEATIKSVVGQFYSNYELFIVDGGSQDDSLSVINEYEEAITKWVSESDKGVYYAMNKAIDWISGEWVVFMNSGDVFYSNQTLDTIFCIDGKNDGYDVLYGDVLLCFSAGSIVNKLAPQGGEVAHLCHQSTFYRFNLFDNERYNVDYELCADHAFTVKMKMDGKRFLYVNKVISRYDMSGVSSFRLNKYYMEMAKIDGNYSRKKYIIYTLKTVFRMVLPRVFDYFHYRILKRRESLA